MAGGLTPSATCSGRTIWRKTCVLALHPGPGMTDGLTAHDLVEQLKQQQGVTGTPC